MENIESSQKPDTEERQDFGAKFGEQKRVKIKMVNGQKN